MILSLMSSLQIELGGRGAWSSGLIMLLHFESNTGPSVQCIIELLDSIQYHVDELLHLFS